MLMIDEAADPHATAKRNAMLASIAAGFEVTGRARPVEVLCGERDTLLPIAHSRHTADVIPRSNLQVLSGHGHLSILSELPAIARARARSS